VTNAEKQLESLVSELGVERAHSAMLEQQAREQKKIRFTVDQAVMKKIREGIIYEIFPHIHELEIKINAVVALYGNHVDPERFPLSAREKDQAELLTTVSLEAFIEGIKEDSEKGAKENE